MLGFDEVGDTFEVLGKVKPKKSKGRKYICEFVIDLVNELEIDCIHCTCMRSSRCEHLFAMLLQFAADTKLDEADWGMLRRRPADHRAARRRATEHRPSNELTPPLRRAILAQSLPPTRGQTGCRATVARSRRRSVPLLFFLLGAESRASGQLTIMAAFDQMVKGADAARPSRSRHRGRASQRDHRALALLDSFQSPSLTPSSRVSVVPAPATGLALSFVSANDRLQYVDEIKQGSPLRALRLDIDAPFRCITRSESEGGHVTWRAELQREHEVVTPELLLPEGFAVVGERLIRAEIAAAVPADAIAVARRPDEALAAESEELTAAILQQTVDDPACELPVEAVRGKPEAVLTVRMGKATKTYVPCELQFDYGYGPVAIEAAAIVPPRTADDPWLVRDNAAELDLLEQTVQRHRKALEPTGIETCFTLRGKQVLQTLTGFVAAGLRVLVDGKPMLATERVRVRVESGIDWFDVAGHVTFADGTTRRSPPRCSPPNKAID